MSHVERTVESQVPSPEKPNPRARVLQVFDRRNLTTEQADLLQNATENLKPYNVAAEEIQKMAGFYQAMLDRLAQPGLGLDQDPAKLKSYLLSVFIQNLPEADREANVAQLTQAFENQSFLFEDILTLARGVVAEAALLESAETTPFILYDPKSKTKMPFVSHETLRLLRRSRMLGLVPFSTLDKLQNLKIKGIGSSVAAQIYDMLVAMGAENIEYADNGELELSNGPRLTGDMAAIGNLGESKAGTLLQSLYQRNPYGNFVAHEAIVTTWPSQVRTDGTRVINLHEFLGEGAELLIEVIDDAEAKLEIRLDLIYQGINIPILFVADVAPHPIVGLEIPAESMFNQSAKNQADWEGSLKRIYDAPDKKLQALAKLYAITEMIGPDIPTLHLISAMQLLAGTQFFLSQDPVDTRINAASAATLILDYLKGESVTGHNFTAGELETRALKNEVDRTLLLNLIQTTIAKIL